jgi:hypothetical protein
MQVFLKQTPDDVFSEKRDPLDNRQRQLARMMSDHDIDPQMLDVMCLKETGDRDQTYALPPSAPPSLAS